MYKIAFNNVIVPFVLLIVSIVISAGAGLLDLSLPVLPLPVWMLSGVALVVFILAGVLLYHRANVNQYMAISGLMLLVYFITMVAVSGAAIIAQFENYISMAGINLTINIVPLVVPVLLSIFVVKLFVRLDEVKKPSIKEKPDLQKEDASAVPVDQTSIEKPLQEETAVEELPVVETPQIDKEEAQISELDATVKAEDEPEEVYFEDIIDDEPVPFSEPASQPQEDLPEEVFFEDMIDETPQTFSEPEKEPELTTQKETDKEPEKPAFQETYQPPPQEEIKSEEFDALGDLPDLDGDIGDLSADLPEVSEEKEPQMQQSEPEKQPEQPRPQEIAASAEEEKQQDTSDEEKHLMPRLTDSPRSKDLDDGGKITSIGKLLVDHRDIENIIETNALMQSVGAETTTTNIISAVAGGKTNEKLAAITEIEGVSASVIVNEAGFIRASTIGNIHKEQVIGAMASGTFGIIAKSMDKLGFKSVKDIAFESATGTIILNKFGNDILSVFVESGVQVYEADEINDMMPTIAELSSEEVISTLSTVNGILGVIIATSSGDVVASKLIDESKNVADIASVLPTFYSNLGVFIKNMEQNTLRKVIIATSSEMLLLTTIGANILMIYTTLNTAILPKDIKIQYETMINS